MQVMANANSGDTYTGKTSSSSGLKNAILILPLIAILALSWLILLKLDQLPKSLTFNQDFTTWLNFWVVILIILIVILICIPQTGEAAGTARAGTSAGTKKSFDAKPGETGPTTMVTIETGDKPVEFVPLTKEEGAPATEKPAAEAEGEIEKEVTTEKKVDLKVADVVAPAAAKGKVKPEVIEYPLEVEGGIYGDTFIDIDDEIVLKLRSLVVKDIYLL